VKHLRHNHKIIPTADNYQDEWKIWRKGVGRRLGLNHLCTLLFVIAIGVLTVDGQNLSHDPVVNPRLNIAEGGNLARRIMLSVSSQASLSFDEPISSIIVLDEATVAAQIRDTTRIIFTGLRQGETTIIINGQTHRRTIVVEVIALLGVTPEELAARSARTKRALLTPSGTYSVSFSPAFDGGPAALRQTFDYSQTFADGRRLHLAGDVFKFFGGKREVNPYSSGDARFGLNRLALRIDSPTGTLDLLDSELNVSPLTLNSFTMRGVHLTSTTESPLHGLEFFIGLARPSFALFDHNAGYVGGAVLPILHGKTFQLRAGVLAFAPQHNIFDRQGGIAWHMDGRFAPDERTTLDGEADLSNGALSWRARFNLQRRNFIFSGEHSSLDVHSPLVAIGAQSSGRRLDALTLAWQPSSRFNAMLSFSRAATTIPAASANRPPGSHGAALNSSDLFASFSYQVTSNSRFGLRVSQQEIDSDTSALSIPLQLGTRSSTVTHNIRFGGHWTNDFEAALIASRAASAGVRTETGQNVREELRRSCEHWSAAAFFDYTHNTPTLAGIIIHNPELLPMSYRRAYDLDPARFLTQSRDVLPTILSGIELPLARNLDAGARVQGAFSRYTVSMEARYGTSEIFASQQQRSLMLTGAASVRLDAANSVQVSGTHSSVRYAIGGQSLLTVSYVHRFGSATAGEGFQFGRLFGLDHGRIDGRVFFDANGDGIEEAHKAGITGVKIRLDKDHTATTDEDGRFHFSGVRPGDYNVTLISDELGVKWRATTPTEQPISLSARQSVKADFGVSNFGSLSGRVFNDLYLGETRAKTNSPGVGEVRLVLHPTGSMTGRLTQTVDQSGIYDFRNLSPGDYTLEIDPVTLPADYRLPQPASWQLRIEPLRASFLDIPLQAQRAVSGVAFIDKVGDGKLDPEKDELVPGARIVATIKRTDGESNREIETFTDARGAYLLRNLPAGKIEIRALSSSDVKTGAVHIELSPEPVLRRSVNVELKSQ